MKLTNYMRDAFIRAAMLDVPSIDYAELIRSETTKACEVAIPAKLRELMRKDPSIANWLNRDWLSIQGVHLSSNQFVPRALDRYNSYRHLSLESHALLVELEAKRKVQATAHDDLYSKLKQVAYAVTTRKALADALPEFEKYLPADTPAACKSLPAVANVLTDFVKAGWPKDMKKMPAAVAT